MSIRDTLLRILPKMPETHVFKDRGLSVNRPPPAPVNRPHEGVVPLDRALHGKVSDAALPAHEGVVPKNRAETSAPIPYRASDRFDTDDLVPLTSENLHKDDAKKILNSFADLQPGPQDELLRGIVAAGNLALFDSLKSRHYIPEGFQLSAKAAEPLLRRVTVAAKELDAFKGALEYVPASERKALVAMAEDKQASREVMQALGVAITNY